MPKTYFDDEAQEYKGDNLYFIEETTSRRIKIGRGANAVARLATLQTGNSDDLHLIDEISNQGWQEAFWHACWDWYRVRGEWFEGDDDLRKAIATIRKGGDWTDHVPRLVQFECDEGEWQEHMLDALDAYTDYVLIGEGEHLKPKQAAQLSIYDDDFDGRCVSTQFADALARLTITEQGAFEHE